MNALVVAIKVGIVVLVIGFGAFYVDAELGTVHSAEHRRMGRIRLERHSACGGHHLFRLHRLRRCLDRGAGGEESAARRSLWHSPATSSCTILYVLIRRAHRDASLSQAQ